MTLSAQQILRPILFGEVLYDTFPDGTEVLGGAPFNVAWHLQGLGLKPQLISRIGEDARGKQIVKAMTDWEMSTETLQIDPIKPTGSVNITFDSQQHHFHILPEQAYDFIEATPNVNALFEQRKTLLYCGSLAARSLQSKQTLQKLLAYHPPCFVDINLRAPWWDNTLANHLLSGAKWAKVNDDELASLHDTPLLNSPTPEQLESSIQNFREHHQIELLIVTCAERGAYLATDNDIIFAKPPPVKNFIDTIGAGDAFSAIVIYGLIQHWPISLILQRALNFATSICEQQGATYFDQSLYQSLLNDWSTSSTSIQVD